MTIMINYSETNDLNDMNDDHNHNHNGNEYYYYYYYY